MGTWFKTLIAGEQVKFYQQGGNSGECFGVFNGFLFDSLTGILQILLCLSTCFFIIVCICIELIYQTLIIASCANAEQIFWSLPPPAVVGVASSACRHCWRLPPSPALLATASSGHCRLLRSLLPLPVLPLLWVLSIFCRLSLLVILSVIEIIVLFLFLLLFVGSSVQRSAVGGFYFIFLCLTNFGWELGIVFGWELGMVLFENCGGICYYYLVSMGRIPSLGGGLWTKGWKKWKKKMNWRKEEKEESFSWTAKQGSGGWLWLRWRPG